MTLKLHKVGACLLALAVIPQAVAVAPERPTPVYREGEVLVRYRATAVPAQVQSAKAKLGLVTERSIGHGRVELLKLPSPMTTRQALEVLRADPTVEHAEPNFRRVPRVAIPNDPLFGLQWGLRNTGQANFSTAPGAEPGVPGADLNMVEAWDGNGDGEPERIGVPSVIVAVIDDAIDWDHADFTANIVARHNFIDCQDPDDPGPVSGSGQHGTLTSGCIAAVGDNARGVAGVAWGASLMPLKFGFDTATHIEAIEWARDHGAKVINASFGGPGFSQVEEDLIASLAADDILYVASAGNDDSNTDLAQLNYPANYDADNIVAVAATNRQDDIASFSQYGPLTTDVAAPGLQIVTTRINDGYTTASSSVSGTSFSSPYAAGVAALLKSHVAPAPDWREIKSRLIESGTDAVDAGGNNRRQTSGGRIDADQALEMADRPALVLSAVSFDDVGGDGNGLPDPGETVAATVTVRNLWQGATGVTATLTADNGVTVTSSAQALGTIASLGEAQATFTMTIPAVTGHRYVTLTLALGADGGYAATRSTGFEIGTLAPGVEVSQPFVDDAYDEFHAWHVTVPASPGKTLFINTTTPAGEDIDLLARRNTPPRYAITVGINPEVSAGFFCTSGTTSDCVDPATLVSGRLDGTESVSVADPPAGNYHIVVVNFDQAAVDYTIEAVLLDGDLRPAAFDLGERTSANNTDVFSNEITVSGTNAATPITVVGGEYRINNGGYTSAPGMVLPGDEVQVRIHHTAGFSRAQLTIGGVTGSFLVNVPPPPDFDSGDTGCDGNDDDACSGFHCGSGGVLPASALLVLLIGALARRRLPA